MDFTGYLEPVTIFGNVRKEPGRPHICDLLQIHTPENGIPSLNGMSLALLGVPESRNSLRNKGCEKGPDEIRRYLYRLYPPQPSLPIADLGNIKQGHTPEDTYTALAEVVAELLGKDIIPIILGGSQELTYATYLGYEKAGININLLSVDSCFDLGETPHDMHSGNWLTKVILRQPSSLFNYTHLGYQTYFVDPEAIRLMKNMMFDVYRLGQVTVNLNDSEPVIRNADLVSIDISAIRASDAPGCAHATPNGFYGEEMCQLSKFAGMSDKVSSIGFYEFNPEFDHNGQTAHLTAQMIWYFIDGFLARLSDFPSVKSNPEHHYRYYVKVEDQEEEILFFKSKKSDRWWMQVPCPEYLQTKYHRHITVPCSYADYQSACANELPDRFWQVFQKIM